MEGKVRFSLARYKDARLVGIVERTDKRILALWAIDCAQRVMPFFEKRYPQDKRPRKAIEALREWMRTGKFSMPLIRKASLNAHAAAREVGEGDPARSAARAAGQAVATAHVKTHSMGASIYALQAIYRACKPEDAEAAVKKERAWQIRRLLELRKLGNPK